MFLLTGILILVVVLPPMLWLATKLFKNMTTKKAEEKLEALLFPDGRKQKLQVAAAIHKLTRDRFSEKEVLNYFMKIKGIQLVPANLRNNFWVKRYLFSPTKIKLNYFEQVKFYEMFFNYPGAIREQTKKEQIKTTGRGQNPPPRSARKPETSQRDSALESRLATT